MPQTISDFCHAVISVWQFPALAILLLSFISFCLYGIDKWKAQTNRWRISEKALILSALFFGAPGAFLGMQLFRHKTKHWYFAVFVPLFMILQLLLIAAFIIIGLVL
ncbi:MAG: DUF1294 domain-containing protein [Clostridia bacterium]|nr:DUF1294 domain-containing protein [Clostridia bacterium]